MAIGSPAFLASAAADRYTLFIDLPASIHTAVLETCLVRLSLPVSVVRVLAVMACTAVPLRVEEPPKPAFPTEDLEFFEASVRPLLIAQCQECHGPKKQEAKLRLD